MAERRKPKASKKNGGEEGTDGAKQKGGAGGKEKRGLAGAFKRVTGQSKATPKKKERRRESYPLLSPITKSKRSLLLDPAPLEKTPPIIEPTDPVQPIASVAVVPAKEIVAQSDITVPSFVPEPVVPQQYDDVKLSVKLARVEMENAKYKERHEQLNWENEALWKEVEELRYKIKMGAQDIELPEKAQVEEAEIKNDAHKKLKAQLKERKEEIEAHVNERVREEVNKNLREAVKAQLTSQQIDEQRKVFAAHLKEKEEKAKTQYEVLLASKDEEIMEQLKQKEEVEYNLQKEITTLQLKIKADNEDQVARVRELDKIIGKLEKDKREVEQNFEKKLMAKEEVIQELMGEVDYFKEQQKVQNNALLELKESLEGNEKQLADTMKAVDELKDELSNKVVEIEEKEKEIRLTEEKATTAHLASEEKKQTVKQLKGQVDELVKKSNAQERQIKDLVEKIQLKEAENAIYKEDFESERKDRRRIYGKLKTKTEQYKADMAKLTEKLHDCEEEIQVLSAQVNAYSREVDEQKGLVTQSQEKHKTEVNELNERLSNELKSKQQMAGELDRMRQQLDNVSADKEELLSVYKKEQTMVTDLEDKIKNMKQASMVLKDKMLESQEEVASLQQMLSGFQNTWKLSPKEVSLTRQELGRGGWGVVWVGQLRVAVKQLHKGIVSQHNMETFHREIDIMSQLRHPNLVQFIGAVLSDCPMIVTEVMDTSLREAYENEELTPDPSCRPVILSILHDVAEGLNYLHCLPDPIIHRDVSSANVLLQSIGYRRWKGKISDFGSAKLAKRAITEGPGAFVYGAPEAFQSITSQDPTKKQTTKMDVFSYGVLLCEIIICRFPERVHFQDMLRQVHSISNRPSGTRDTQGSLLHSLIVSCCHDDPSRRPTMKQIIEQLDIIAK